MRTSQGLYINGSWSVGAGAKFTSHNPATGAPLWQGSSASEQDVVHAVSAARAAFPGWANLTMEDRIRYLEIFAAELKKQQEPLAEIISQEVGKPLWESKTEVAAMVQKVDISVEAQQQRCGTAIRKHPLGELVTRHRPHGVAAVFGPFNFPGHLPNGHLVPALLAGNTAVLKPSELAPRVAEEVMRCWEKACLPKGVLNMVQGGHETGRSLAANPGIDGLFFTGSFSTGQKLSLSLAAHPEKILALEMGGNNPLLAGSIKDIPAAVYTIIQSAFATSGQRCTCARRLIVLEEAAEPLISALVDKTRSIKVGSYSDRPEPFMGPVITPQTAERLLQAQQKLIDMGAAPLLPMRLLAPQSGFLSPGLLDVTGIKGIPDEEIFGPLLQIVRSSSFSEAIAQAGSTAYGLAAGLISDSESQYEAFRQSIKAGVINWNTPLTGASSQAPFGGVGRSGNNRPSAFYAADYCNYPVASIESPAVKLPETLPPGLA